MSIQTNGTERHKKSLPFSYIVDYYIYKVLKEFEKEGKILVILCENRIFLSIFAEYRGTF